MWCCVWLWCCVCMWCCVWVVVWCVVKLGTRKTPLCVRSKRLRVYGQDVSVCTGNKPACARMSSTCGPVAGFTRRRPDRTHGGVLNVHTGVFSLLSLLLSLSLSVALSRSFFPLLFSCLVSLLTCLFLFSLFSFLFSPLSSLSAHTETRSDRQVTLPT